VFLCFCVLLCNVDFIISMYVVLLYNIDVCMFSNRCVQCAVCSVQCAVAVDVDIIMSM